jgi:2-oxoglutarate ferredoxin oxidoreductase subunit alpha
MMEPVELPEPALVTQDKPWALTGAADREPRVIRSLFMLTDDAEIVVAAFGTAARIARGAVLQARAEGIRAGLVRPITLFPFPEKVIAGIAERAKRFLVVEMNLGQMVEDVRLAVNGRASVSFFGRPGGAVLEGEEILQALLQAQSRAC